MSERKLLTPEESSASGKEQILPLAIPDLKEVKAFANHLHILGKHWRGEIFGWPAEYTPESDQKPIDSNMTFTPADFWIGESDIWFFSLMWEYGKHKEPVEFSWFCRNLWSWFNARQRCSNQQIVQPIFMVDKTIQFVGWRGVTLSDFGTWAIRSKIMQQCPGAH